MPLIVLAERSGLSPRFVTEIQAGRANVSVLRLARLARALGTTASAMLARADSDDGRPHRVITLLGVRGAGKSTIGPKLAERLGFRFVELDRLIEGEAGLPIAEIFATHGEDWYRRLEVDALRRLLDAGQDVVVATGGGIVENPEAWELLRERTLTVWLRASAEDHWDRVVRQGDPRPMAGRPAAKAELRRLLARRATRYRRARYRLDTSRRGIDDSVRFLADRIKLA